MKFKPETLNKFITAAFFLTFLFPHFVIHAGAGRTAADGYAFLFSPSNQYAVVDVPRLLITWFVLAVAAIIVNRRELLCLITLLHRDRITFEQAKLNKQIDLELQKQRILADAIVRHAEVMNESKQKNMF